jgi:dTDP-4-dehydrorhamnose reductase
MLAVTPTPNQDDSSLILIVGASGFLGSNVLLSLQNHSNCVAHSSLLKIKVPGIRSVQADLRLPNSALELVNEINPSLVINCAALANINHCEQDPELAFRLNTEMPNELAIGCSRVGARLVHVSTDAVFSGEFDSYNIEDSTSPINVYGETKARAEEIIMKCLPTALIIRTNIIGWSPTRSRSLLEFFVHSLKKNETCGGFYDSLFRPIAANNFWTITYEWLRNNRTGISHAFGSELISKYEFGCRIARQFNFDPHLILPTSIEQSFEKNVRGKSLNLLPSEVHDPDLIDIDSSLLQLHNLAKLGYQKSLGLIMETL